MKMRVVRWAALLVILIGVTAGTSFAQSAASSRGRGPAPVNQTYLLQFRTNVNGASVTINGQYQGSAPLSLSLQPGYYEIVVTAPGYREFRRRIRLSGDTTVDANLSAENYSLTVTSNVNGARVFLNGQHMGQTPLTTSLQPGTYNLRVEAGGYRTYSTQVTVNQSMSVNAYLQGELARIHIRIPEQYLNINGENARGDRQRARNDIRVYVDNHRENRDNFELQQGSHTIRFESGGFEIQRSFHVNAGQDYTISPELSIRIN